MAVFRTEGNPHCHIILRGGKSPNYQPEFVAQSEAELRKSGHAVNLMIDCSHGNSQKNPAKQREVLDSVAEQISQGNRSIIGVMLESYIEEGNQPIPADLKLIRPGVSITDACISWTTTEAALRAFANAIRESLQTRAF